MGTRSPERQAELERIGAERLASEREAERHARRRYIRACLECVGSCVVGVAIMGYAFHVTDRQIGEILLATGMLVGYSGMTWALARAYLSAEEHGDI